MAWAIFHGKDVENRTWPLWKYIKKQDLPIRIYIHASKGFDADHYNWIMQNENRLGLQIPQIYELVHGAIIGEVTIVGCTTQHTSMWFTGPYAFELEDANEYDKPIPCKGMLGLFEPKIERV